MFWYFWLILGWVFSMFVIYKYQENHYEYPFSNYNKIKIVIMYILAGPLFWIILVCIYFAQFICSDAGEKTMNSISNWFKK